MFMMKIIWGNKLAANIYKNKSLNPSQYARKAQIPQMNVLNKKLSYDIQLVMREESFQSDNDALSCYDRIIDNLAVIAAMRIGLSESTGKFLKRQLHEFKHCILLANVP